MYSPCSAAVSQSVPLKKEIVRTSQPSTKRFPYHPLFTGAEGTKIIGSPWGHIGVELELKPSGWLAADADVEENLAAVATFHHCSATPG